MYTKSSLELLTLLLMYLTYFITAYRQNSVAQLYPDHMNQSFVKKWKLHILGNMEFPIFRKRWNHMKVKIVSLLIQEVFLDDVMSGSIRRLYCIEYV